MTSSAPAPSRVLVRARGLEAFRRALVERALAGQPLEARRRIVLVPTRAAAELLRQSIEEAALSAGRPVVVLPDLLTRDGWMARLHDAVPSAPPRLSRIEREVLLERAAQSTSQRARLGGAPFHLRPGLMAAMLDLYDELRRRQRTVRRFVRPLLDQLRVERGTDRGTESLIHQTCFLGLTFLAYERLAAASGGIDEHQLRSWLLAGRLSSPHDHVIVGVADRPSDPRGLWPADFDLLSRLPGLRRLEVVVTEETHDAGFRQRVEQELPGIEEVIAAGTSSNPVIVLPEAPPGSSTGATIDEGPLCFVSRDREEELRDVVRAIRARAAAGDAQPVAVVFQRPLPYLYLARQVLEDGRVPYQALDALPLASEPYAALLDLVLAFARTGGTREAAIALLRSRLLAFEIEGIELGLDAVSMLDGVLAERRVTSEADAYVGEVAGFFGHRATRGRLDRDMAQAAARVAAAVREELAPFRSSGSASRQVAAVAAFLRRHERPVADADPWRERHLRARAAVLGALDGLAAAWATHAAAARDHDAVTAAIHHVIERQTFAPRRGEGGVHLVDAVAVRFGAFAHVHLVGLVETDWPERPRRSVFYGSGLLNAMGWPQDADQMRAEQAAFTDLLGLASATTTLHAFQLEGDSVVALSPVVELARERPTTREAGGGRRPVFMDEIVAAGATPAGLDEMPAAWLALRRSRPPLDDRRYSGTVPPRGADIYRVSRVEHYVDCPFKYFAENVLRLPEERDEMSGLTPLERGTLVHDLFERFYRSWQDDGRGAITPATLPEALERFASLTREALAPLPEADRALEETRLLGSIVARGLAERVFELEADAGGRIVDRLVEHPLEGRFTFPQLNGLRQVPVAIRGKADRVDVFDDGSLRVIDYKLGRLPDTGTSVQIGVYAHAVRQSLEARDGRPHPIRAAMYLAFGDDRKLEGRLGDKGEPPPLAVEARASEFAGAVARIEAGEFPPRPRRPAECQWCSFAGVCRKEYRVESDEAAESL